MELKEIKDLVRLLNNSEIAEIKIEKGDFKLALRTKSYISNKNTQIVQPISAAPLAAPVVSAEVPVAAPATPNTDAAPATPAAESTAGLIEIKSPIVGTFYRSSSPDKPVYAKIGDSVSEGSVVCIVEAMKLFNEIESEVSGKIVKVLVEDASPVEYDQPLFLVDPKG